MVGGGDGSGVVVDVVAREILYQVVLDGLQGVFVLVFLLELNFSDDGAVLAGSLGSQIGLPCPGAWF